MHVIHWDLSLKNGGKFPCISDNSIFWNIWYFRQERRLHLNGRKHLHMYKGMNRRNVFFPEVVRVFLKFSSFDFPLLEVRQRSTSKLKEV